MRLQGKKRPFFFLHLQIDQLSIEAYQAVFVIGPSFLISLVKSQQIATEEAAWASTTNALQIKLAALFPVGLWFAEQTFFCRTHQHLLHMRSAR